jgi:hypothetical protein
LTSTSPDDVIVFCNQWSPASCERIVMIPAFASRIVALLLKLTQEQVDALVQPILQSLVPLIRGDLRCNVYALLTAVYMRGALRSSQRIVVSPRELERIVDSMNEAFDSSIAALDREFGQQRQSEAPAALAAQVTARLNEIGEGSLFEFCGQTIKVAFASLYGREACESLMRAFQITSPDLQTIVQTFTWDKDRYSESPFADAISSVLIKFTP